MQEQKFETFINLKPMIKIEVNSFTEHADF